MNSPREFITQTKCTEKPEPRTMNCEREHECEFAQCRTCTQMRCEHAGTDLFNINVTFKQPVELSVSIPHFRTVRCDYTSKQTVCSVSPCHPTRLYLSPPSGPLSCRSQRALARQSQTTGVNALLIVRLIDYVVETRSRSIMAW